MQKNENEPSVGLENEQVASLPVGNHLPLTQYSPNEAEGAIDAFQLFIKVRDRCRAQGLIDW